MARHLRFKLKKEIMGDSVIVEECDSDDQSESVGADVYELTVCHPGQYTTFPTAIEC
jgi:hypothetical protein